MKKLKSFILSIALISALLSGTVMAAGNINVVSTVTGENNVSIFVKGANASDAVTALVGTSDAESVSASVISEDAVPMKTLIMLDNSISIRESDRKKIAEIMQDMISDRMPGEIMAIATFSEEVSYLSGYTSDYAELKAAVDAIEYKNQETYLTDVLCDLIPQDFSGDEDIFKRILIISDGVDNKSLGKTRDDLKSVMKEDVFPIYSIGCYNKNKSNNDELENMFSISSQSNAEYYLLDDFDNVIDITTALRTDRDVVKYKIIPSASQMDGGTKAVKLTIGSESVSVECRMPQNQIVEEAVTIVEETEESIVEEPATIEEEEPEAGIPWLLIAIIAGAVILVILIVVVIIIVVSNNKKKSRFETIGDDLINEFETRDDQSFDNTVLIDNRPPSGEDGGTVFIWNNAETYHIILTDVASPAKTLQIPLTGAVTIGRKPGCDAVYDYDKSVSGRHCEISVRNGHFFLKDLQSSNGTFVNGSKILTEAEIFSGNVIKLGRLEIRFEVR